MFHASDMHTITYVIYIGNIQSYNCGICTASVQSIRIQSMHQGKDIKESTVYKIRIIKT